MYKNDRPVLRQDYVRFAWQYLVMQSKSESISVQVAPDDQFWFGIFVPDTAHHPAASGFVYDVYHVDIFIAPPALFG